MYGALWRVLPGPAWLRVLLLLALAAVVVVALFQWVFPWIEPHTPFSDQPVTTVETP